MIKNNRQGFKARRLLWAELTKYEMFTKFLWESSHFEDWEVYERLKRWLLGKFATHM